MSFQRPTVLVLLKINEIWLENKQNLSWEIFLYSCETKYAKIVNFMTKKVTRGFRIFWVGRGGQTNIFFGLIKKKE